jgi:preprotein translocase SecE subunit
METLETQGWFHLRSYKPNQGVRVRRGTIAGILAVGVSGIITMATHRLFGAERPHDTLAGVVIPNDLYWIVPFYGPPMMYVYLMFKVHILMPIVIFLVFLWVALRVVNMPVFADFLIATEAEMNKVSWTTRRRLIQDTWVVLATVFFFTMFLFVVDILWIKILSAPYVQVLMYDPREKEKQQQETAKW